MTFEGLFQPKPFYGYPSFFFNSKEYMSSISLYFAVVTTTKKYHSDLPGTCTLSLRPKLSAALSTFSILTDLIYMLSFGVLSAPQLPFFIIASEGCPVAHCAV